MNTSHRLISTVLTGLGALTLVSTARAADTAPDAGLALEEVVVTGSRVITNGNDSPSPVTVVTIEDLQASRPTTVFEALQELPQFSAGRGGAVGGSTGQGGNNNSISSLNLRALGSLRGLVLFDGHRVAPQNLDGQVDINQIPQMLLQRVDVQTGGASAVYGSDGITGVVNFVTNRKFEGIKANLQYGMSELGDTESAEAGLAGGTSLFGGRGHIMGSVQYHHDDGLYRDERPFLQQPGTSFWTLEGNGTVANPYFLSQNARNSSISAGGKIVGPGTAATNPLLNQNFTTNGVLSAFQNGVTQGVIAPNQIGGQGGLIFQKSTLKTPLEFVQVYGRFDFDFTDNLHFYVTSYYNTEDQFSTLANVRSQAAATNLLNSGFVMSVNNAFLAPAYATQLRNAGLTTFNVGKVWDTDFYPGQSFDFDISNLYVNTGLEGSFGNDWKWELSYSRTENEQKNVANQSWSTGRLFAALDAVVNPANGQIVCQVSLTQFANLYPGCVPINIFGPTATTQAQWDYVRNPTHFKGTTDMDSVDGYISGAPFNSWAGPVNMALSGNWRKLEYLFVNDAPPQNQAPLDCTGLRLSTAGGNCVVPTATNPGTASTFTQGQSATALGKPVTQEVKEVALEADVPLLTEKRFAQDVGLNLAYRHADYESTGTPVAQVPTKTVNFQANTWKVGLDWHFDDAFTVRGTRSRDFRAPNLGDLFAPGRVQGFIQPPQDRLGLAQGTPVNANPNVQDQNGGNPNLKPEVAYTTTIGFVFKPTADFSLAIDAFDITISDAIASIGGSGAAVQDACYASAGASAFCALQARQLGNFNVVPTNVVTTWYTQPLNLASIKTQGVDVEGNYKMDIAGHPLQLRALVAYQPHIWTEQPLSPTLDAGGVSSPRIRANVSAHFGVTDNLTLDWSTRWRSGLKNLDPRSSVNNNILPGSQDVESIALSNATITYNFDGFTHGKLDLYLNVLNVFNQIPPTYVGGTGGGGVSFYPADDAIGRYYNLGVRLRM